MPRIMIRSLLVASSIAVLAAGHRDGELCTSQNNVFTVKVNLYAGELGYYEFEECDGVNPTIGMEVGETYTFDQSDRSNYYHPMGFSYRADGAHADEPELEPGVSIPEDAPCTADLSCPAPMYFKGDEYLGVYNNLPGKTFVGDENFGLGDYEPLFFYPLPDWAGMEPFSIKLTFDDETYSDDVFYFCHIHQFMAGRIKLMKNGVPINVDNTPLLGYEYDEPGRFDKKCGTFDLGNFQLPNKLCPSEFVCDKESVGPELQQFGECIDAMNCHMLQGMTTGIKAESEVALFIHQMIPHHQNAVNMAKALLVTDKIPCDDLTDDGNPYCVMQTIAREIINGQNFQIQAMQGVLEALNYPEKDNCKVPLEDGFIHNGGKGKGKGKGKRKKMSKKKERKMMMKKKKNEYW